MPVFGFKAKLRKVSANNGDKSRLFHPEFIGNFSILCCGYFGVTADNAQGDIAGHPAAPHQPPAASASPSPPQSSPSALSCLAFLSLPCYPFPVKEHHKKHLHQPPAEFARAEVVRDSWYWKERQERCERKNKRDRELMMPSHPKPGGKMRVLYHAQGHPVYEDIAEYRKRAWNRAHRRAHKTTEPPKG